MTNVKPDLNFDYIQKAIDEKLDTIVYLINGVSLKGKILNQDDLCIILTCNTSSSKTGEQLVFKEAISTIST